MILSGDRSDDRATAHGLAGALAPVLADVAQPEAVGTAREVAQVLGLRGLDGLLAACAAHAGQAWPAELAPALDRLRRLAARTFETGDLEAFRESDLELAGLADQVSALQWSPAWSSDSDTAHPVATLTVADTLEEMQLADDAARALARRARVVPPVAAALRAALDWLVGGPGHPLGLRAEDSLLEVSCDHIDFDALTPATEVLAAVGANLGPGAGPVGTWMIRVPLHTGRAVYLMLVHGGVPIAIPWHAVLRLHMAAAADMAERASLGDWPVLKGPLGGTVPVTAGDVPLALVAHGRKRGWLVAEKLVWRLHAESVPPMTRAPAEGLTAMVETEEGEHYWLADPAWLLRSLEAPSLVRPAPAPAPEPRSASAPAPLPEPGSASESAPAPGAAPRPPQVAPPASVSPPPRRLEAVPALVSPPPRESVPAPAPPPQQQETVSSSAPKLPRERAAAPAPAAAARTGPVLRTLTREDVERIDIAEDGKRAPAARSPLPIPPPPAPVRAPDPAPGAAVRDARAPSSPAAPGPGLRPLRAALVAEDSITARIFLARLLTRLGFEVRTVDTAAALRAELERGTWSLACVDIELPDEAGVAFLAGLVARHGARTPFVALVRDAEDRVAARRAGIERMLRKPFDHQELEQVLGRAGLVPRRP